MTVEEHPIAMYDIHGDRPRDHLLNPAELLSYFGIGGPPPRYRTILRETTNIVVVLHPLHTLAYDR